MSKTESEQQADFMDVCGQKRYSLAYLTDHDMLMSPEVLHNVALWKRLIMEECQHELINQGLTQLAVGRHLSYADKLRLLTHIADAIVDSKYVLDGLGNCLGIPLNRVFDVVHSTNMAKAVLQPDGTLRVKRRPDGKILKPEGWIAPNIQSILENELVR